MEPKAFLLAAVLGIGATITTDLWTRITRSAFGVPLTDWCLVGRWVGHFAHGKFVHNSIGKASAVSGECLIGWLFHYAVGVVLAAMFLAVVSVDWASAPTPFLAIAFGAVTVLLPWFVLHPGLGAGVMASRAPNPTQARLRSLINHMVFGFGLFATASALQLAV
jgi:hypothetical protein